ncbi:deoxyribodipyrimidine photolyase-related protein [Pseudarthrobacter enclensis]|uniref:Deoxyribodipyrimidine photolyase n=1 Tax=Pseudarthrobacter enclensis TaxID=993070 RepID=A0A0V8IW62_9MICC|nr:cryptochrome/photolyase family protein [Pseudarthrobacter enclensis]KSU79007.1 deoxyribodipyrimidine photolyase [Pseudarthrobacter enclensis]SCB81159.1 deoxyribodipyrimidine photolyase-related protein [Pseudarthrobacter enclensis]
MTAGRHLRLVLPHQLFEQQLHDVPQDMDFVLIEHDLLFRQYAFHAHKLVLHRASMARFARRLRGAGHDVTVLASTADRTSRLQLEELIRSRRPRRVTCFDVVDDWLEQDLSAALDAGGYRMRAGDVLETPNFLTDRRSIADWFGNNPARMQDFYVWQRRRLDVLVHNGHPVGGKWSFDAENRKKLPKGYVPPPVSRFRAGPDSGQGELFTLARSPGSAGDQEAGTSTTRPVDVERAIAWVAEEFPEAPGDPQAFAWPTDAAEARTHLKEFVRERLAGFGPYEDAISAAHPFIHHGLLTPALNIGLLDPREVLAAVLDGAGEETPLASLEGFVRQLIGWREYMRATYRVHGRRMRTGNLLNHRNEPGAGWWDGTTGLAPVDMVISRVLATGYCHHIERLMVLGNAMSLLRIHPDAVYEWFMELFVDAYDWVMVPNVYAMSQFASGAGITTKPYASGSNYIRKMSDLPPGEWAADWDGLYWSFISDNRQVFAQNPRSRMIVSLLDSMDPKVRDGHLRRAQALLHPDGGSRLVQPGTGA